jgi:hypothetical protein
LFFDVGGIIHVIVGGYLQWVQLADGTVGATGGCAYLGVSYLAIVTAMHSFHDGSSPALARAFVIHLYHVAYFDSGRRRTFIGMILSKRRQILMSESFPSIVNPAGTGSLLAAEVIVTVRVVAIFQ